MVPERLLCGNGLQVRPGTAEGRPYPPGKGIADAIKGRRRGGKNYVSSPVGGLDAVLEVMGDQDEGSWACL